MSRSRKGWRHRLAVWLVKKECERCYRRYGAASITISRSMTREESHE
jgi:hypothetical protein